MVRRIGILLCLAFWVSNVGASGSRSPLCGDYLTGSDSLCPLLPEAPHLRDLDAIVLDVLREIVGWFWIWRPMPQGGSTGFIKK